MMNNAENTMHEGENLIYDAVKDLTKDQLEQTVRKNAAAKNFALNDEHMSVIHSLIEHYKQDCKTRDCLAAHEHMRFLEEAYESKGGSKYLYMLFDAMPDTRGVLMPIHELAGLPALRLETDEGFGTAF
ncbi:TusE/DsrC/DsvC family sulfur relay protein [Sulfuricella sp.]|uniref:TusE/DsrC/DsvC family sulfur relay protein n=1 Tax=Sulfuricella sp. TaxID=2099377 RepID=UPI002BA4827E|nr:TusE/DsrC/DsvC family sulfur relay protein [Sulfuricella sp.]HUX65161.1 TusE/DsrC/DsvC family sulfur relay protein [Sulfuricella sp.]